MEKQEEKGKYTHKAVEEIIQDGYLKTKEEWNNIQAKERFWEKYGVGHQ